MSGNVLRHEIWIVGSFGWMHSAFVSVLDAERVAGMLDRRQQEGLYLRSYGDRDCTVSRLDARRGEWVRVRTLRKRSAHSPLVAV